MRWVPGNHSSVKFWTDDWNDYIIAERIGIPMARWADFNQCIDEFRMDDEWIIDSQFAGAFPDICADIVATKISSCSKDHLVWTLHKSGNVSSKAAYELCRPTFPKVNWGSWLWAPFIPPTRSTLVWRLVWSKVPSWDVLNSWGIAGPSICVLCRNASESIDHLFGVCPFVNSVMDNIGRVFGKYIDGSFGFHHMFVQIVHQSFSSRIMNIWRFVWITFFWMVWSTRNSVVHGGELQLPARFIIQL